MTDKSLSRLYRLSSCSRADSCSLDADTLVAVAAGTLAPARRLEVMSALAASPVHADMVRMLRELEPASAQLAQACGKREITAHVRNARPLQHAAAARRRGHAARWSGLAACLSLALGVWAWQHHHAAQVDVAQMAAMEAAMKPDRIFTSQDQIFSARIDTPRGAAAHGDGLFRADFNGS